jgi:hypothetical protein
MVAMNLPSPKICCRICKLFELCGSSNSNEANSGRDKLVRLLAKHGLQWRDITAIIAATEEKRDHPAASQADPAADAPQVNVLDLALRLIELYIDLSPEQRMPDAALSHLRTFLSQSAQAEGRRQAREAVMSGKIEWTGRSRNPVKGCSQLTPGSSDAAVQRHTGTLPIDQRHVPARCAGVPSNEREASHA